MEMVDRLVKDKPLVIFTKTNPKIYELDQIPNGHQIESALVQLGCQPSVPAVFIGQKLVGSEKQVMSLHVQNQLVPMLMQAGAIWLWK
ncbi:Monothiol glutaredoxin-S6 [Linum perenne]